MYSCVHCKSLGSWTELSPLLAKKSKKLKTFEVDCKNNLDRLNERLHEITNTTEDIRTFEEDVIRDLFNEFGLPVSFCIVCYCALIP